MHTGLLSDEECRVINQLGENISKLLTRSNIFDIDVTLWIVRTIRPASKMMILDYSVFSPRCELQRLRHCNRGKMIPMNPQAKIS